MKIFYAFAALILMVFLLESAPLFAANISVMLDREKVIIDESFTLIFESDASVDDPDFSPLEKDFQILNQSHGSSYQYINGKVSTSIKWTLNVMANRTGNLVIPPIKFGDVSSPARAIAVLKDGQAKPGQTNADIFIEVDADPSAPYVQAQVLYTVRLFLAVATGNKRLSEPDISSADAIVEKLGDDKRYETFRNGRRYIVFERRYAIFPQHHGKFNIDPILFEGTVGRQSNIFSSPFGSDPFSRGQSTVRKRSKAIVLDVKPALKLSKDKLWLPVRKLKLQGQWSEQTTEFQIGEPLTWTLTLTGEGLTASQLPEIPKGLPESFKQYPDQPALNNQSNTQGMVGIRQEKIAVIPSRPGEYVIAAIEIPWWNTTTEKIEIARLPAQKSIVPPLQSGTAQDRTQSKGESIEGITLEPNSMQTESASPPLQPANSKGINIWMWLSMILGIGWLVTLMLWLRRRMSDTKAPSEDAVQLNMKILSKQLRQACEDNDPVGAKNTLLKLARVIWDKNAPTNLGDFSRRCDASLAKDLDVLNRVLYAPGQQQWEGSSLWKEFKMFIQQMEKTPNTTTPQLEPLFRL